MSSRSQSSPTDLDTSTFAFVDSGSGIDSAGGFAFLKDQPLDSAPAIGTLQGLNQVSGTLPNTPQLSLSSIVAQISCHSPGGMDRQGDEQGLPGAAEVAPSCGYQEMPRRLTANIGR